MDGPGEWAFGILPIPWQIGDAEEAIRERVSPTGTELRILAIQGFEDMKEQARDTMIRDKFIAGQRQCALCRNWTDLHRTPRLGKSWIVAACLPMGWSMNMNNGQYRATRMNQKLVEEPGNEQQSEREGQPLRPPEIKAPLTQAGVFAEISNGNPIGAHRGKIVSGATGQPIFRNFRPWKRGRGRSEIPGDRPVPVPPKWTGDRRAFRRRSSGIWTGGCGRLKAFSRSHKGTVILRHEESRRP